MSMSPVGGAIPSRRLLTSAPRRPAPSSTESSRESGITGVVGRRPASSSAGARTSTQGQGIGIGATTGAQVVTTVGADRLNNFQGLGLTVRGSASGVSPILGVNVVPTTTSSLSPSSHGHGHGHGLGLPSSSPLEKGGSTSIDSLLPPPVLEYRRTEAERAASAERLNLDRKGLTDCLHIVGEEGIRLLNYQNNSIKKISNLKGMPFLIFLDLYNNQVL